MRVKDYKPHIDGLRALAVLPVIFFHAGFEIFQGGFVGVDIFFVISGYLITNIILKDLKKNTFKISNFYIRRARRILPALFLVTLSSLIISIFLMSEEEIKFFSRQAISVVLFISNFFFWNNTGYFNPNSELQPLLHTWSLSVEEQFYIFFPLFLIFIWKFFRGKLNYFLILIICFSLILCQMGGNFKLSNISTNFPFFKLPFEFFWQAGSANFFLPFGRIWELLFGSLVSVYTFKKEIKYKKINNLFSILGIGLILLSIMLFSENLQYPSLLTFLPVFGTTLILLYSNKPTLSYKIFSYKPLVFLGLISYSLYLWHQPLLAFNRIYFGTNLSFLHTICIIILTFLISVISWKLIEKPFRNKELINNKKAIGYLIVISIVILSLSSLAFFSKIKTFQPKIPNSILNSFQSSEPGKCFDINYAHLEENKWFCDIGNSSNKYTFAVIGDSHALALKAAFEEAAIQKNQKGILLGFSGCPGLLGVNSIRPDSNVKNCKLLNEKLFKFIKTNNIKKIFLASRWSYYTIGGYNPSDFNLVSIDNNLFSNKSVSKKSTIYGIENTIKRYNKIGVEVVFVHQVPEQIYDPKYVYLKSMNAQLNRIDLNKVINFSVEYNKHAQYLNFIKDNLKLLKKNYSNIKEIDFDQIFCDKVKCYYGSEIKSFYSDKNHLSISGSMKTVNLLKTFLK